jgi:hypothetical protein
MKGEHYFLESLFALRPYHRIDVGQFNEIIVIYSSVRASKYQAAVGASLFYRLGKLQHIAREVRIVICNTDQVWFIFVQKAPDLIVGHSGPATSIR